MEIQEIKDLVPIEWANRPVLLTKQVADAYGTTTECISHNFCENKEQFKEGEHYFKLTGAALREFKKECRNSAIVPPFSKMANCLYLWTKEGCVRHCKMLNTKEAWAVFDMLERFYFGVIRGEVPAPEVPTTPAPNDSEEADTLAIRIKKQFDCPTDLAVVYALLMSNFTVKLGMTKDLTDRIKQLKAETKLDTLDFASTPFMPRDQAAALEQYLLDKFSAYSLGGEFFDVRFLSVKAALAKKFVEIIHVELQ